MKDQEAPAQALPQLLTDIEIAPLLRLSVGFLQRDRRAGKRIPFIRIGDRVLYDPAAVAGAIRAMAVGGSAPTRQSRRKPSEARSMNATPTLPVTELTSCRAR